MPHEVEARLLPNALQLRLRHNVQPAAQICLLTLMIYRPGQASRDCWRRWESIKGNDMSLPDRLDAVEPFVWEFFEDDLLPSGLFLFDSCPHACLGAAASLRRRESPICNQVAAVTVQSRKSVSSRQRAFWMCSDWCCAGWCLVTNFRRCFLEVLAGQTPSAHKANFWLAHTDPEQISGCWEALPLVCRTCATIRRCRSFKLIQHACL